MQNKQVFRRILVPVDGSLPSMVAQEMAAFLAMRFESEVTVLHVSSHDLMTQTTSTSFMPQQEKEFEPISTATGQIPRGFEVPKQRDKALPEEVITEITNYYSERGEFIIEEATARFKEDNVPVKQRLVEQGDPADVILNEADKGNYDLIVVGNSEEEKDLHLGSVAKAVTLSSKIPVLITRLKTQISNILVAVDDSTNAEKALLYADALSEKTNAKITLLHVQESVLFQLKPETSKEIGTRILSNAAAKIHAVQPEQKLEFGDPAKKILDTAKKETFDLIIIGSHGHGSLRRLFLGSVSDHVVQYADIPVLVIK